MRAGSVKMPMPGTSPLFLAVNAGDLMAVKRLIAGLPVDCTHLRADCGSAGWTPLERAAWNGRVEVVKYLIGEGADIHRRGQHGDTPLLAALSCPKTNDHITCIKVLLAAAAEANFR